MIGRYEDDHAELVALLRTAAKGGLGGPDKARLRELVTFVSSGALWLDELCAGIRDAFGDYGRPPRFIEDALNSGDGSYKP